MNEEIFNITPETKIDQLLKAYPELEATLIDIAPAFKKLQNPVLRKTIAKVTSIRQAAKIGNIPLGEVINRLRQQVGQQMLNDVSEGTDENDTEPPGWFDRSHVVKTLDARPMLEAGEEPVKFVFKELDKIGSGQIFELVTPFLPAPLIAMAQKKGFQVWTKQTAENHFSNYFLHA